MPASEDLDRVRVGAVTRDRAVVVTIGADQIGKDLRIARVGLRSGNVVPVAIPGGRERVDRVQLIASRDQRLHPQAAIRLDPDHDLSRIFCVLCDELMESADARQTLGSRRRAICRPVSSIR